MSNETTQKRSLSVSLGAAFLMATSAIGPGFLTQTSQFTAKYLSSFAFVIVCVIIMDMIAQTMYGLSSAFLACAVRRLPIRFFPVSGIFLSCLLCLAVLRSISAMSAACHSASMP